MCSSQRCTTYTHASATTHQHHPSAPPISHHLPPNFTKWNVCRFRGSHSVLVYTTEPWLLSFCPHSAACRCSPVRRRPQFQDMEANPPRPCQSGHFGPKIFRWKCQLAILAQFMGPRIDIRRPSGPVFCRPAAHQQQAQTRFGACKAHCAAPRAPQGRLPPFSRRAKSQAEICRDVPSSPSWDHLSWKHEKTLRSDTRKRTAESDE
jgi:hypothetical protein